MNVPRKITPCPLVDAIVELRFSPKIEANAVFGIVYNSLRDKFSKIEKLPIVELPESLRENDPVLQIKPHYKLFNKNIVVQSGPRVLTVSSYPSYIGWESLLSQIKSVFGKLRDLDIVDKPNRLGLRYINFFELNIFEKINLEIIHIEKKIEKNPISLRIEFDENNVHKTLQISNSAKYKLGKSKHGSTIDIDVYREAENDDFLDKIDDILQLVHREEKQLFFSLLQEEYLKTLNPEY